MNVLALIRNEEELPSVLDYAVKITAQGDELYLLNIIAVPGEIPTSSNGLVLPGCTEFDLSLYHKEQRENDIWIKTPFSTDLPLQREVAVGNRQAILKDRIAKWDIDMILTSSELNSEMTNLMRKTKAERIKDSLDIPILNLKCDRRSEKIEHIAIVSDFLETEQSGIRQLKHILDTLDARLTLFSFCRTEAEIVDMETRMDKFIQAHSLENAEKKVIVSDNKEASVQGLLFEHAIQLMVVMDIQRKGFKSLFKGDLESDLLNHMLVPILAI